MSVEGLRLLTILMASVTAFAVVTLVFQEKKLTAQNSLLKMQQGLQAKRLAQIKEYNDELERLIGDIEQIVLEEDVDKENLDNLVDRCKKHKQAIISGNVFVDSLLAYKKSVCETQNINFTVEVLGKMEINLRQDEYIGLLGNLIDNAIEAANRSEEQWVTLKIRCVKGQWVLRISNSKSPNESPLASGMKTTKTDSINHGIGLRVVDKIVRAHNGVITRKDEGNVFETLIAIDC